VLGLGMLTELSSGGALWTSCTASSAIAFETAPTEVDIAKNTVRNLDDDHRLRAATIKLSPLVMFYMIIYNCVHTEVLVRYFQVLSLILHFQTKHTFRRSLARAEEDRMTSAI
jgi:hypothetical protein